MPLGFFQGHWKTMLNVEDPRILQDLPHSNKTARQCRPAGEWVHMSYATLFPVSLGLNLDATPSCGVLNFWCSHGAVEGRRRLWCWKVSLSPSCWPAMGETCAQKSKAVGGGYSKARMSSDGVCRSLRTIG